MLEEFLRSLAVELTHKMIQKDKKVLVVDRDYFDFLISKLVKASQSRHLELL
jgi:hypothetical protein